MIRAIAAALVVLAAAGIAAATTTPSFGPATTIARLRSSGFLDEIAVADLTGDRRPDIVGVKVAPADETRPIVILAGNREGGFQDLTARLFSGEVPQTQNPSPIVLADFNRDGRRDVFIADRGADNAPFDGYPNTLFLSAPGGKFIDASGNLPDGTGYTATAAAADVDGDGAPDLYIGNICCGAPPEIARNDGRGNFTQLIGALPADILDYRTSGEQYTAAAFADVNGDGAPDLVLAGERGTPNVVLLNDGRGHFAPSTGPMPAKPFSPDGNGLAVAPIEVNGDHHVDLLIAFTKPNYVGRWIQVLVNNGDGSFRDETASRLPQNDNALDSPRAIRVADLNGDGKPDFAVATFPGSPAVYSNRGDGTFGRIRPASPPYAMLDVADVNRDGRPDLVSVYSGSHGVDTFAVNFQRGATKLKSRR